MTAILLALVALIGLICGVLWRECYEILKRLQNAARVLLERQAKQEKQEQRMSFVEPSKWEELDDQEKLEILNS